MNGKRFFLDTNAVVQLLSGNVELLNTLDGATYVATSVICELGFLSFPGLSEKDKQLFQSFLTRISVIDVCTGDVQLKERIQDLRREKMLKLPDAVIAASAAVHACLLVTADKHLLKLPGLAVQGYRAV
jgi:predicted nucleic acid-binding protein